MKKFMLFFIVLFFSFSSALTQVNIDSPNAPLVINSSYSGYFSPGEQVPVEFFYRYSCPSSYSIDIYKDNDLSDSVCTRIVNGMGWIVRNTYSGIVCEKTNEFSSNTIQDVCGISVNAEDGSYTLRVTLFDSDDKPVVFDSRVGAVKIVSNKPDLEVESVFWPENAFSEKNIPVKVSVKNSGLMDSDSFFVSLYLISGSNKIFIGEKKVVHLNTDAVKELSFNLNSFSLFPGNYFLEAVVDSDFSVEEQNENNNFFQEKVLLSAPSDYSDLIISSVDFPDSVEKGEQVPVLIEVKNNGLTDISKKFIVSIDSDKKTLKSKIVYGLNSGEKKVFSFFVGSSDFAGETELTVFADKEGLIKEISKENNSKKLVFSVSGEVFESEICYNELDDDSDGLIDEGCKADYSVELSDYVVLDSGKKLFSVFDSALNQRKLKFNSSQIPSFFVVPFEVNVKFGENKDYLNEFSDKSFCVNVSSLDERNKLFFVFSASAPESISFSEKKISFLEFIDSYSGFYSYLWTVDGVQKILPDSYSSVVYAGDFSAKNSGFYFSPELLGFDSDFKIKVTSDCYGLDLDADTSNDSDSLLVKIVSKEKGNGIDDDDDGVIDNGFDLKLEDFYFEPKIVVDEKIKAFLTVSNKGKFVSPQVKVSFFDGQKLQENLLFSEKIDSINAGETKTFLFTVSSDVFSKIENKVIAVLDYENSFAESDEFNNVFSFVLFKYINSVNLKISEVNADKKLVYPGEKVKLSAEVKNNGFVDSSEFFVIVRDSFTNEIVDSVKVSSLKAGIKLQDFKNLVSVSRIFFDVKFDDLSTVVVDYDYVIPSDLIGNKSYDVCVASDALGSKISSCTEIFFVVSTKADLKLNFFRPVNDLSVIFGEPVLLELEMENQGIIDAENFSVQLYYYNEKNSKKIINSISGFSLKSGKTDRIVLSFDFSEEINGSIFAELDSLNKIDEENKSNNLLSVNLFSYLVEVCYNDLDDDLDGLIDEGCPDTKFVVVNDKSIKEGFVLEAMQKEIISGQVQKILLYHSVFGPLENEKITVITPSKKSFEFFTGKDGSISFLVDETGNYEVLCSIKAVVFNSSFKVISEEQANYSFVYVFAELFFGSPEQTNPFLIPVILLLAFLVSAYVFSVLSRHYFEFGSIFVVKSNYRTAFSLVFSVIVFFLVLFLNKFFGLIVFVLSLIAVLVLTFFVDSYYSKKAEEEKLIQIKKEKVEFEKDKKDEKKKDGKKKGFILRL